MKQHNINSLLAMELHQEDIIDDNTSVLKVKSGWIYKFYKTEVVDAYGTDVELKVLAMTQFVPISY